MSKPSYLRNFSIDKFNSQPKETIAIIDYGVPSEKFSQEFAGESIDISPNKNIHIGVFRDIESKMAFHRFSWLNQPTTKVDPSWVAKLWSYWVSQYGNNQDGLAWQTYTSSERLINLVKFFVANGVPNSQPDTVSILSKHGQHIFDNLEYYGPGQTGNHFLNNGRCLYIAGILLGIDSWIEVGKKIIINESKNLFNTSGELREGSVHYHLLITSWCLECWLIANAQCREEEEQFFRVIPKALSAVSFFDMPAGLPLIGDVSPDCTPSFLYSLLNGKRAGWLLRQDAGAYKTVKDLINKNKRDPEARCLDDWSRFDQKPWSVIWSKYRDGWQPYPGHAHVDFGSFEMHFQKEKIFIDLGRRSYGPKGDVDRLAISHNVLLIDGQPAYPENRAYYSTEFREYISGPPPVWESTHDMVSLFSKSFSRIKGVEYWNRNWRFSEKKVSILDEVSGQGLRRIDRYFHTLLHPKVAGNEIIVGPVKLVGAQGAQISETIYWFSYGKGQKAYTIKLSTYAQLPFKDVISILPKL
ncbi:MAG: hypothetical protein CFH08_00727 [Alphaproteobacteria bacterium MarineAlpha3_Bin7]|nr:MAG: hypothetical protein CFH08_00727 [Alphaproteobacteria bacterium MarineAlpha3_Bin7]|tara:strand:- start:7144 stop:8721 length:1578 start_codon:yes stop_codon:yes gene_type:complete